jgi:primosomal protein N' (replication factor Y)
MNAALPGNFKLSSETLVTLSPIYDPNYQGLNNSEFIVCEALSFQQELSVDAIRKILDKKNKQAVYPVVNSLLQKKVIYLKEELKEKYKPKTVTCVPKNISLSKDLISVKKLT